MKYLLPALLATMLFTTTIHANDTRPMAPKKWEEMGDAEKVDRLHERHEKPENWTPEKRAHMRERMQEGRNFGHEGMKERYEKATPEEKKEMEARFEARQEEHRERFENARPEEKAKMKEHFEKRREQRQEHRGEQRHQNRPE